MLDLVREFADRDGSVEYLDSKYGRCGAEDVVKIDCAERVPLCKAVCRRILFALTRKEAEKGTLRWAPGRSYLIALTCDGYCAYLGRKKLIFTIYERRPVSCRTFDCRTDRRWPVCDDFDGKSFNSDLVDKMMSGVLRPDKPFAAK